MKARRVLEVDEKKAELAIARARKVCRKRDADERAMGMAPPSDCDLLIQIRTAREAIYSALVAPSWDVVAEAYVLLDDAARVAEKAGA
jgi:hypothetical protein